MRKSGLAAATGLGSLVLLLAACGGSGSNTAAGSSSSAAGGSSAASGPATPTSTAASSATAAATATKTAKGSASAKPHKSVAPLPSGGDQSIPPVGTTVMIVQHSAIGWVLAEASGQVVYTYAKDKKGGAPTCTGPCAEAWPPVTGMPKAGPADTFPAQFGVVKGAGGAEQITYDGMPLYTLKDAKPLSTAGNGLEGLWHVVPLSASDITSGG